MDSSTLVNLASTLGLISTTAFYSMNYTVNYLTFPALLLGSIPPTTNPASKTSPHFLTPSTSTPQVSDLHLARQWQEVYRRGHRVGPLSAIVSGLAFGIVAYWSEANSCRRILYVVAAVAAAGVVPWTVVVIMPVNEELLRRGRGVSERESEKKKRKGEARDERDERDVRSLVERWLWCNEVRAGMAVVASLAGAGASLL